MGYEVKEPELDLNLTPLIDVVFLLLIFFIVTSTLNSQQVEKNIQLPTTTAEEKQHQNKLDIILDEQGQIYVGANAKQVSWSNLESQLAKKLSNKKKNKVTIVADEKSNFQEIVRLMDITKKIEADNLSFVVQKE
ncbi:ExbD/TolR family protein [Halanaerobacter jeridensis]|nr:biopolymer transporter ExbD [Halanaerobacter jeridensis]